jgi:hypothetical protein
VTEQEKLRHEIYVLGQIVKADALALASETLRPPSTSHVNLKFAA